MADPSLPFPSSTASAPTIDAPSDAPSTLVVYPARERIVAPTTRDLLAQLNTEQAAAAAHGAGPLLVIAGAGTGKTRTLVYRVAHLIEQGAAPERILLLTSRVAPPKRC